MKLKIVYDDSSTFSSLNECLIPLGFDVPLRFRAYKVTLIRDIKQAYLNVEVNKDDRFFLRFLWIDDINTDTPKLNHIPIYQTNIWHEFVSISLSICYFETIDEIRRRLQIH